MNVHFDFQNETGEVEESFQPVRIERVAEDRTDPLEEEVVVLSVVPGVAKTYEENGGRQETARKRTGIL